MGFHPQTTAVFGMLAAKDLAGVISAVRSRVDRWNVATLPGPRGASAAALRAELLRNGVMPETIRSFDDVGAALGAARAEAHEADRITVFGSFLTVGAAIDALKRGATVAARHG